MSTSSTKTAERESRAQAARPVDYRPPDLLEIPEELTAREKAKGNILRWLRIAARGEADFRNISQRMSEGYRFLTIEEAPELQGLTEIVDNPRWGQLVTMGDLALAVIPEEKAKARQRYYENMSAKAMDAVRQQLRQSSSRELPIYDDSTQRVTRGRPVDFGE